MLYSSCVTLCGLWAGPERSDRGRPTFLLDRRVIPEETDVTSTRRHTDGCHRKLIELKLTS